MLNSRPHCPHSPHTYVCMHSHIDHTGNSAGINNNLSIGRIIFIFSNNFPYEFKLLVVLFYIIHWSPNWGQVASYDHLIIEELFPEGNPTMFWVCNPTVLLPSYIHSPTEIPVYSGFHVTLSRPDFPKSYEALPHSAQRCSVYPVSSDLPYSQLAEPPYLVPHWDISIPTKIFFIPISLLLLLAGGEMNIAGLSIEVIRLLQM